MSQKVYVASPGLQVAGSRLLALVSMGERRQGCSNGNIPYRETVPLIQDHDFYFFFSQKANYYSWLVLLRNSQLTAILVTPEKVQVPLCWGDLMLQ